MVAAATPSEAFRSPFWVHDAGIAIRAVDGLAAVGVLDWLTDSSATVSELADALGLKRRTLELALDVARRIEVVAEDADGRWSVDPVGSRMILSVESVAAALRGEPPTNDASSASDARVQYPDLVERIGRISSTVTGDLVPALRAPGQRVLELAAGASPWGRALCTDDPATTVTAVELPHVIDQTRLAVRRDRLEDRYRFVEADVFALDDVGPADLVLLAGFCRLLGEDQNRELFARAARWCAPGGRIGVVDAVSTPEAQAAGLAGYELNLLTRTSRGRCWSFDHYARWLADAGFTNIELGTSRRPEISLVIARRTES